MIESKSILAKLMATENISVVHERQAETAAFDLKTRTLYLPVWKDMTGDVYDLLVGHEVGHAKETPEEGWHSAISENGSNFKTILNVVEDSRIERMIKTRYPGLKKSFVVGYRKLFELDIFGVKDLKNFNSLNLADRINLEEKIGNITFVPFFNDVEKDILKKVRSTKTWEEVVVVAKLIAEYIEKNEQDKINSVSELDSLINEGKSEQNQEERSSPEQIQSEQQDQSEQKDQSDQGRNSLAERNQAENASPEQNQESEKSNSGEASTETDGVPSSSKSITDEIFRQREKNLLDTSENEVRVLELPVPILENIVIDFKNHIDQFEESVSKIASAYGNKNYFEIAQSLNQKFKSENKSYISLLVQEFEMKKNASQYARSRTSKTGILESKKLSNYRFSNDLFKKITTTPQSKNHGIVMVVDFSGSMQGDNLTFAINQVLCLTDFCKKVNIPFVVYSFTNKNEYYSDISSFKYDKNNTILSHNDLTMTKLISSDLSSKEYTRIFNALLVYSKNQYYHYSNFCINFNIDLENEHSLARIFSNNATPYIEMLIASRVLVEDFKKASGVDIVNFVILSDGDGTGEILNMKYASNVRFYVQHPVSGKKVMYDSRFTSHQDFISSFILEEMDANCIGYFISENKHDLVSRIGSDVRCNERYKTGGLYYYSKTEEKNKQLKKQLLDTSFVSLDKIGFDDYYYVWMGESALSSNKNKSIKTVKKQLLNDFKNSQNQKLNKKLIVSKFCESIAT